MTEKLAAGLGEGVKGLVAKWRAYAASTFPFGTADSRERRGILAGMRDQARDCANELETALEAAARLPAAPDDEYAKLRLKRILIEIHHCDGITADDAKWLVAALATPSPQAPQEQSNAFSTTSAREQSSATTSGMLNVTELAEHITYKIQSLLTDKYTNSFRIACGVIEQELQKAVNSMPHDALVGEAFYCESPAATQEPAGSGALREAQAELIMELQDVGKSFWPTEAIRISKIGNIAQRLAALSLSSLPAPEPYAYICPANCGCMWRDNGDFTMSLFGKKSESCEVCEPLALKELVPVYERHTQQASSEIREALRELVEWAESTRDHRFTHDMDCVCNRARAALAPSRQGAGGKGSLLRCSRGKPVSQA